MHDILEELRDGQIEVGFVHKGLDDVSHKLDVMFNRLAVALIVTGGLIGSSLIGIFADEGPQLFGVHFLSVLGFVASACSASGCCSACPLGRLGVGDPWFPRAPSFMRLIRRGVWPLGRMNRPSGRGGVLLTVGREFVTGGMRCAPGRGTRRSRRPIAATGWPDRGPASVPTPAMAVRRAPHVTRVERQHLVRVADEEPGRGPPATT